MIIVTYVNGFKNRYYGNIEMGHCDLLNMLRIKATHCIEHMGVNVIDFMEYHSIASIVGSEDEPRPNSEIDPFS